MPRLRSEFSKWESDKGTLAVRLMAEDGAKARSQRSRLRNLQAALRCLVIRIERQRLLEV